jgi:hypothetical protein
MLVELVRNCYTEYLIKEPTHPAPKIKKENDEL